MDLSALTIVVQLIFLEGVLSIDNAAVLGAMVAHLPNNQPIPWPSWLQFMNRWSHRFGVQREAALKVGLLGAYVGRGLMLVLAGLIIQIQWVRLVGAAYLFYLGIEHLAELYHGHHEAHADEESRFRNRGGFWSTVLSLELADLAFSVDNVIAAVALSNQLWVVLLGVSIGIVLMRFAASIFTSLINWEPALSTGAYLLLLAIGIELLLKEYLQLHIEEYAQFAISIGILALTVVVARVPFLRSAMIIFRPFMALAAGITWVIEQIKAILLFPFKRALAK
ncbi:MAG: TerC family protein [Roseiflexaceae bacterium]